jgi:hypothetical protein
VIGCYSYTLVPVAQTPIGASVRASLAPSEAERVRGILGVDQRAVDGTLVERPDSGGIVLDIPTTTPSDALAFGATHQRIAIGRDGLRQFQVRRLDRRRTVALLLAGSVIAAYVSRSAFGAAKEPPSDPGRGGTDASRMPWIGRGISIP